MFTLIQNYKSLVMGCVVHGFAGGGLDAMKRADTNNDNVLGSREYNESSKEERRKMRKLLQSQGKWEEFKEDRAVRLETLEAAQQSVTQDATRSERQHRRNIERGDVGSVKELQKIIETPADGKFGKNSEKALVTFIKTANKSKMKELQKLIGTKADGDFGKNSNAALNAFLNTHVGNPKNNDVFAQEAIASVNTKERKKRTTFENLGIMSTKEFGDDLASIDAQIDANSSELLGLQDDVIAAKKYGKNVAGTYKKLCAALKGKLDAKTYAAFSSAKTNAQIETAFDYFNNALMGGSKTVNVAQGRADSKEYVRSRKSAINALKKAGFSSKLIKDVSAKIAELQPHMKGNLASRRAEGYAYSVRTQGKLNTVEPFNTTEQVQVNGEYTWDIDQTKEDMYRIIDNMSVSQVEGIIKYWGIDRTKGKNLSQQKYRIKEYLNTASGKRLDIQMYFAENCGNISFIAIPTTVSAPVKEGEGTQGNPGDGGDYAGSVGSETDGDDVSTSDDNGSVSSSVGEE